MRLLADRAARIVPLYRRTQGGLEKLPDQNGLSSATYFSGAGGLVSTAEDYAQFAAMLVNGGELNGMGMSPRGIGFGLGVQVVEDPVGRS